MADNVYYGTWINWSRGKWNGSTITLSPRSAGFLVAFLAIYVSIAGGSLWRLFAFALHQRRTTRAPKDGIHYQHQAILRNAATPGVASWQFIWLIPPWTKRSRRPLLRTFPLALAALLNLVAFFAAGILVAEVTRTPGSDVLIRSPNCGNWTLATEKLVLGFTTKTSNDTVAAANYARSCYNGQSSALECNRFIKQSLPYTIQRQNESEACPFQEGMCLINWPVVTFDTGNISSHEHLGINARPDERISYRRKTTCAPLKTRGFITTMNYTDAAPLGNIYGVDGDVIDIYDFGHVVFEASRNNFTLAYNRKQSVVGYGYSLSTSDYNSGDNNSQWHPHEAVRRDDGDVSLTFVSANSILYYDMVTDPIFQAVDPMGWMIDNGKNITLYTSKYYVNPLGCVDQHQFCNPRTGRCTELDSYSTAVRAAQRDLELNPVQYVTISVLSLDLYLSTIKSSILGQASTALQAQNQLTGILSGPLEDTQWQKEVEFWFSTGLAKLQKYMVEYASGPTNVLDGTYVAKANDTITQQLCSSQVMKAPAGSGLTSFSTLGVSIILAIGGLLILVHTLLECVLGFCIKDRSYKLKRWALDEKLQLQRLAFEGAGWGTWKSGVDAVPVTTERAVFGVDIRGHRDHPTFYSTCREEEQLDGVPVEHVRPGYAENDPKNLTVTRNDSLAPTSSDHNDAATDFSRGLSLTSEPIDWPYRTSEEQRRDTP